MSVEPPPASRRPGRLWERWARAWGSRWALAFFVAGAGMGACDGEDTSVETAPIGPLQGASGAPAGAPATLDDAGASCKTPSCSAAGSPGTSAAPGTSGGAGVPDPNAGAGGVPGDATELPDLVLDAAYLLDTTAEDRVSIDDPCLLEEGCVAALGERRVVRFGSRTGNIGAADLSLGVPEDDNPYWSFDSCDQRYELPGFGRYELLDPSTGAVVAAGTKSGFCIADAESWRVDAEQSCQTYDCNRQGISQGCADNYGSTLECQWVDITDVAPGTYVLRATINASRSIAESDYANDSVELRLEIGEDRLTAAPL